MEAFFFSNSPLKQAEFNYFHVKYKETKAKELVFEIMKQEEKRVIIFRILLRIQRLGRVALAVRLKKKTKMAAFLFARRTSSFFHMQHGYKRWPILACF